MFMRHSLKAVELGITVYDAIYLVGNMKSWAKKVWNILRRNISIPEGHFVVDFTDNPFGLLVAIILSQNTSDKNSIRALLNLKDKIGLDPARICEAKIGEIERAIYSAGLYRQKAKAIKNLARKVIEGLDLKKILKLETKEARKILLGLEGIGKKTVDVFLALHGKRIMGVDVHARRIALRWGIAKKDSYDEIQKAYVELFDFVDNYDYLHRLLIMLGREYCRARNPRCDECPLRKICPKKGVKNKLRAHF